MKGFFKSLLASVLGCTIVLVALIFFLVVALAVMSLDSGKTYSVKDNTILNIKLEGKLSDRADYNPMTKLLSQDDTIELSTIEIIDAIKKAKDDDNVKGIYIESGIFMASSALVTEIREELIRFKSEGKFIIAYGDIFTQNAYYLSSVADKIILNPEGMINMEGYASKPTFYKGLLDKLGIKMQIFKVGTFKSAVEPFIETKMSDANREQVTSFMNDLWQTTLKDISSSRAISVDDLNILADSMPLLKPASFYIKSKMVDTLMYQSEVKNYLASLIDVEKKEDITFASISNMSSVGDKKKKREDIIAILYAEGEIKDGTSRQDIHDKYYVDQLTKLMEDDKVKAVVLRVNSPGGSAYASEQIWKAVTDLKAKKPVVVSMGTYAASGGYYISANASKIIAQPNTLTGSIGIFGMFPIFEELTEKVGVSHDAVKTNKYGDFGDLSRQMRDDEIALVQARVERGYDLFLTRCSEGRNIAKDSLDLIAQGRVWTGNQALELGLIDGIGGIDFAIFEAAKLANLTDYSEIVLPQKMDFMEQLLMSYKEQLSVKIMKNYLGSSYKYFEVIKQIEEQNPIQARMPYNMSVY